jgi:hypothetical protein
MAEAIIAGDGALITGLKDDLAKCQARESAALRHLQVTSYHPVKDVLFSLFENLDSTALDTMLKAAEEPLRERIRSLEDSLANSVNADWHNEAIKTAKREAP